MEGEVVPSIAREGNRKVGLYEIPERSLNESLNATIARIHATVDFPLQPFVLTSRHGLYSRPSRPLVPPGHPFATLFHSEARLVLPLMPASRLKRRRALSYGVVTRQFKRLTLRVAGEFSRLTSAQCLCLPRPSHHRDSTRLDSTRLSLILGAARPLARSRPHDPFLLFTCAFFHLGIPPRSLPRRRRTRATFAPVPQAAGTRRASTDARATTPRV